MVLAIFACVNQVAAASQEPIVTDRPDFTESSQAVPLGRTQIESGMTWERSDGRNNSITFPEVLIRHAVAHKTEIRIGLPNYSRGKSEGDSFEGFGDAYLGAKFQLGPINGLGLALIPAVFLPVGRPGIRSESASPEVKAVYGFELANGCTLSGMLYWLNAEIEGRRRDLWQATTSFGVPIANHIGAFFEHILDFERSGPPAHTLHSGIAWQPNSDSQVDFHFGIGLTPTAPNSFIGVGYSIRF